MARSDWGVSPNRAIPASGGCWWSALMQSCTMLAGARQRQGYCQQTLQARPMLAFQITRISSTSSRRRAAARLSADHVLQHLLVERRIGNDPFQPTVFLLELLQALNLRTHQPATKLLPTIKCLLRNPCLPANLLNANTFLCLTQCKRDPHARERRPLQCSSPFHSPLRYT